jgi:type VI secretion system protein ImpE
MTPSELFQAGNLREAIEASLGTVKKSPTDTTARYLLAELLCLAGDLERADKQFDTIMQQSPETAMRVTLLRQLVRAETARQQFYHQGRVPEFLTEVSPVTRLHLEASIAIREDDPSRAGTLLEQAEQQRPSVAGNCDGEAFDDMRDMDDMTASFFEVLTSTGKYYWVPMKDVELIEFHAPERPIDLVWRRAHMLVSGGPDGEVYLPAIYAATSDQDEDQLRLGRGTDWSGGDGTPVRGRGQRMFLIGEQAKPIMQIKQLQFKSA